MLLISVPLAAQAKHMFNYSKEHFGIDTAESRLVKNTVKQK